MSTFTLGRVGVDTSAGGDGVSLQHPYEWAQQGRLVTVQGVYVASSDADAVQFLRNWLRLADNPDETWLPMTCSAVSDLNGYAKVLQSNATIGRASLGSGGHRIVEWSAQLERPVSSTRPTVETTDVAAGLTNGKSVTTYTDIQSVPTGTLLNLGTYTSASRTAETGTASVQYTASRAIATTASNTWKSIVDPADWYKAGANVSTSTGVLTGRRDTIISSAAFTVGNGLVRVATGATTWNFAWYNGSAWTSNTGFAIRSNDGTAFTWSGAVILRNSPEECVVRMQGTNAVTGITTADISIRRGDLFARIYCTSVSTVGHRIAFTSTTAMTALTGGLRTTSTVSSQYIILASNYSTATDTTNGSITSASRATTAFAVGVTSSGSTTGEPGGAAGIMAQTFGVHGTTQRVVFG